MDLENRTHPPAGLSFSLSRLRKRLRDLEFVEKLRAGFRSRFMRDGAVLATGALLVQVLAVLTAPIMARLYDPSAYGLLGLFIALYGLLTVPATLEYNQAVTLPKEDGDALAIVKGGFLLSLATTLFIVVVSFSPIRALLVGTEYEAVLSWLPLMAAMVIPGCFSTFAVSWLSRKQQFRILTVSRVFTNIASTAIAMILGFGLHCQWGLLVANAVGALVGAVILGIGLKSTGGLQFISSHWSKVRDQLRYYYRFPLYAVPTQYVYQLMRQSPVLMLTGMLGPQAVGFFNMSNRLLGMPNALFAESLTEVFRQRAAREYAHTGQCHQLYKRMLVGLLITIVPCVAALAAVSPTFFAIFLGEKWRPAGEYSQILCWLFMAQMICGPLSCMMPIAQRQQEDLILKVGVLILMGVTMTTAFATWGSAKAVLIAYVLSYSLVYVYVAVRGYFLSRGTGEVLPH